MALDNRLLARILHANKLASQEQLQSLWPRVSASKDIGALLVEEGILDPSIYTQLLDYASKLQAQQEAPASAEEAPAAPAERPSPQPSPEVEAAPSEPAKAPVQIPEAQVEIQPQPKAASKSSESVLGDLLETSSSYLESEVEVQAVPLLEETSLGDFGRVASVDELESEDEEISYQPRATVQAPLPRDLPQAEESEGLPPVQSGNRGLGQAVMAPASIDDARSLEEMFAAIRDMGASDLHLSPGYAIRVRLHRVLHTVGHVEWTPERIEKMIQAALSPEDWQKLQDCGDLELIMAYPGLGRFRVTLMRQRQGFDLCARAIAQVLPSFEALKLPEVCRQLTQWAQGLVLVTGPAGCGKTTTLSVLVNMVNQSRHDHIITVEDPVEIVYPPGQCQVTQRQVMEHTLSRANALRAALRQDPDILVVSELRDLESMQLAISAAETGHLVFGTMNTVNARRTLSRLIDSFPPEEQDVIRNMVSESLRGIISQQLVPRKDGRGSVVAYEVLKVTPAVANQIRKNDLISIDSSMATGRAEGMVQLDDSLRALVEADLIDGKEAYLRANNPNNFAQYAPRSL